MQCKYKFQNKEKFKGKPFCTCFCELCEDLPICDTNCQVFEDLKELAYYKKITLIELEKNMYPAIKGVNNANTKS